MWLKLGNCVIDTTKLLMVHASGKNVRFIFSDKHEETATKNSPEAAQALFEHVAQILEAKI